MHCIIRVQGVCWQTRREQDEYLKVEPEVYNMEIQIGSTFEKFNWKNGSN